MFTKAGTKVAGLKALLAATTTDPLKLLAVFSSSTGRFGRSGQVAYAAANEALAPDSGLQQDLRGTLVWTRKDGNAITYNYTGTRAN